MATPSNTAPALSGLDTATFLEDQVNATPQIIDSAVTFTDPDDNYDGGTLTVSGLLAEDTVSINNQGTGAGQIGFSGGTVSYQGAGFGIATGGAGGTLTVTFNPGATSAAIDALIQNLTYANSSNTPAASRDLTITVADATHAFNRGAAQFTDVTGAANPFNGIDIGHSSSPTFADLNGDGVIDMVVGEESGSLNYFENTGTTTSPNFVAQTGAGNPLNAYSGYDDNPSLCDLDGDGDFDLVVAGGFGTNIRYLENTGTALLPQFTERTGVQNPFDAFTNADGFRAPALVDWDGDGDLDLAVGGNASHIGIVRYYENTGTVNLPNFVERTGAQNPFAIAFGGANVEPAFADVDNDGDLDLAFGSNAGGVRYFENVGGSLVEQTDAANPFAVVPQNTYARPAFADIDGDGNLDLAMGAYGGTLAFARNDTPAGATVTVNVTAQDDPAVARDDGFATPEDTALSGDVTANNTHGADSDPEGGAIAITAVNGNGASVDNQITLASGALLTLNSDGTFDYDPNHAFDYVPDSGSGASNIIVDDSFTYTVDGGSTATVTVSVTGLDSDGDILNGTSGADFMFAGIGNDRLFGFGGDDTLFGEGGNDSIIGGLGADAMDGGAGDDLFFVDNPGDTVADSSGSDHIYTTVDFTLSAGLAIEYLVGQGSVGLTLTGNELNNGIYGGTGADTMDGGAGDDFFFVNNPGDTVADSSGSDRIYTTVDFTLSPGQAIEYLVGQGSVGLTLTGNELNNGIYGGTGADTMDGGAGDDFFFIDNPGDTVADSSGSDRIYTTVDFTLSPGQAIEYLVGQGGSGLTLTGNELNNAIYGGTGADDMDGGAGDDLFFVNNPGDTVADSSGSDRIYTTVDFALSAGLAIEYLVGQGSVGLTLTGNEFNNGIYGTTGADTMDGGAGDDFFFVNNPGDTVADSSGSDRIYTTVDFALSAGQAIEYLVGQGSVGLTLTGNELNNGIYGTTGADTMDGGAGDDFFFVNNPGDTVADSSGSDRIYTTVDFTLSAGLAIEFLVGQGSVGLTLTGNELNNGIYGTTGADTMDGGAGDDYFFLDNPGDTVADSSGSDRIYTTVDFTLSAGLAIEFLVGQGSVGLTLTGNEINNAIYGGAGADTIAGGGGQDLLTGGGGGDVFVYNAASDSGVATTARDQILDFAQGSDTMDLSAIDAIAGGADDEFSFIGTSAFSGTAGELRYQALGAGTLVSADLTGSGSASFSILLKGSYTLAATDFVR